MSDSLDLSLGQYSNKGRKEINQDFHDIRIPKEPQLSTKGVAIAIADGISSSQVSQIASKTCVTSFLGDYFSTPDTWSVKKSAMRVISSTNAWLFSQTNQHYYDKNKGYVCTFSAMVIRSSTAYIFHIGDTRIYRLRNQSLEQLTQDHVLIESSQKSYLSRAMGMEIHPNLDYDTLDVKEDDVYLFTSDGVHDFLDIELLLTLLEEHEDDLDTVAEHIVGDAYKQGSTDNLTIQLVRINKLANKDVNQLHHELSQKPLPPVLELRQVFDGYTIIRELSSNSRSHVYLAQDNDTKVSVVIKIPSIDLQDDKAYLERFLMEEWIAIRLNSAHLLKANLQTRPRNYLYNVSEYIQGQTLQQWIIDNPKPSLEMVRNIAEQIAKGLVAMHRQEMVHQDLRPANIIIDTSGTVKIIDFGSTRVGGIADINTLLEQEQLLGTALYSAPEYFLSEVGTSRSDLFSLAVIIYQMLSGKFPYGTTVARATTKAAQKKLKYHYLDLDELTIPLWVEECLKKALNVDPYYRYSELSEFLYDLRHPNQEFINKTRAPLVEREPVLVWKAISFVLALTIIILVSN